MPRIEFNGLNGGGCCTVQRIMNRKASEARSPEEHADTSNAIERGEIPNPTYRILSMRSSGAVNEYRCPPKGPLVFCIREQLVRFSQGVMRVFANCCSFFFFCYSFLSEIPIYIADTLIQPLIGLCEVLRLERKRREKAMQLIAPYE